MGLSGSAILMLIFASTLLYGGLIYCLCIAMGIDIDYYLEKVGLFRIIDYWNSGNMGKAVISSFVVILIIMGYAAGVFEGREETDSGWKKWEERELISDSFTQSGNSEENSEKEVEIEIDEENLISINFTLVWEDEPAAYPGARNNPDEFAINVTTPFWGSSETPFEENSQGGEGRVELHFSKPVEEEEFGGAGIYIVVVKCGECGDHVVDFFMEEQTVEDDDGNDWSLQVDYLYYAES